MYLHIGKDCIVNLNDIVGIFDIESLKMSNYYSRFLKNIDNVKYLTDGNGKTLILTVENGYNKAYVSNILSTTIASRSSF